MANSLTGRKSVLYKQIIDWVINCMESGMFKPGDKLPTEESLAAQFQVSRGTVRTALNMLKNNRVIESIHGSGYYISKVQEALDEPLAESEEIKKVYSLIFELKALNYSDDSILRLFTDAIFQYEKVERKLKLTIVECNPDIIPAFRRQLASIPFLTIDYFIIHNGRTAAELDVLNEADIITTTPNHFKTLLDMNPQIMDKVVKYNVSISPKTILKISEIRENSRVGLLCESARFYELVTDAVNNIFKDGRKIQVCYSREFACGFLETVDTLILPYGSPLREDKVFEEAIMALLGRGGTVIDFDYQVDQGSFAYLKEVIAHLHQNPVS
jgi:DNA-binding transcriptional regulator YhcF (GntR family)